MAVRVRLRVKLTDGKSLEAAALINTGFETLKPQMLLPVKAAEKLDLWPNLPLNARVEIYDTAGGPMRVYVIPDETEASVLTEDRESPGVLSDIVISHTEVEILIGDKLAGALKIVIEDPAEGIWRFKDDPPNKKRGSETPKHWI